MILQRAVDQNGRSPVVRPVSAQIPSGLDGGGSYVPPRSQKTGPAGQHAALGVGANSATGNMGGAGIRPVVIVPALFQAWVYQSHAEPGEVLHIARDHGKVMLQGSGGDHSIRRVERTPG